MAAINAIELAGGEVIYGDGYHSFVQVDIIYENVDVDQVDVKISEENFAFIDDHGNVLDYVQPKNVYESVPTPIGAVTMDSLVIGLVSETEQIHGYFSEHPTDSTHSAVFNMPVGTTISLSSFSHEQTVPDIVYETGEAFYIGVDSGGEYGLVVEGVEISDYRHANGYADPAEVYILTYTYQNAGMTEDLLIDASDFVMVDSEGYTMIPYPLENEYYPVPLKDKEYITAKVAFASIKPGDRVLVYHSYDDFSTACEIVVLAEAQ